MLCRLWTKLKNIAWPKQGELTGFKIDDHNPQVLLWISHEPQNKNFDQNETSSAKPSPITFEMRWGFEDVDALYWGVKTRASLPRWYIEEKAISYNLIELNNQENENLQADFLAINPFGKLPVLIDSSIVMQNGEPLKLFESRTIFCI